MERHNGLRDLEAVEVGFDETGVATVRLSRPAARNAIDARMCQELRRVWEWTRDDDSVLSVVLVGAGADFCAGVDRRDRELMLTDVVDWIGPKRNKVWKPVVCAVQGLVEGAAFHLVSSADVVIADGTASFVEASLSHGRMSAVVPVGLAERMPIGEVLRLVLMGFDDAMDAERARQLGLVSEVVPHGSLERRAHELAGRIASKAPTAVQGTVRAVWESQQMAPWIAQSVGGHYVNLGNERSLKEVDPALFESGHRPEWELR